MKLILEGEAKEIADLVLALQSQQNDVMEETATYYANGDPAYSITKKPG